MATYNYIKAVWKNGPNVVSDAPSWVVETIERVVPVWMFAHARTFVGVQFDLASQLMMGLFVSPGAFETEGTLEDARDGSFIHVFASDHPDCVSLSPDQARARFESVYGAPLSDASLRQERSYVLLEFPYHRDLATDLFVPKDMVEGGIGLPDARADALPVHAVETQPASLPPSLSSQLLRGAARREVDASSRDLLDQGLSYKELLARLSGSGSAVAPAQTSRTAAAPGRDEPQPESGDRSPSLLRERMQPREPKAKSESLLDQGLSYQELIERLAPRTPATPTGEARASDSAADTTADPPTTPLERKPLSKFARTSTLLDRAAPQREETKGRPESLLDQGLSYAELIARLSGSAPEGFVAGESSVAVQSPREQAPFAPVASAPVVELELAPLRAPVATPAPAEVAAASPIASRTSHSRWRPRNVLSAALVFSIAFAAGVLFMRGGERVLPASKPALLPLASSELRGPPPLAVRAPTVAVPIAPVEAIPEPALPDPAFVAVEGAPALESPGSLESLETPQRAATEVRVAAVAEREMKLQPVPAVEAVEVVPVQAVDPVEVVEAVDPAEASERFEQARVPPVAAVSNSSDSASVPFEPLAAFAEIENVALPPVSAALQSGSGEATAPEILEPRSEPEAPAPETRPNLKRRKLIGQMQRAR